MSGKIFKKWDEIVPGDTFLDGSVVKNLHERYEEDCYLLKLAYNPVELAMMSKMERKLALDGMTLGQSHALLVDTSQLSESWKLTLSEHLDGMMMTNEVDRHAYFENLDDVLKPVMTYSELAELLTSIGVTGTRFQKKATAECSGCQFVPRLISDEPVGYLHPVKHGKDLYWLPVEVVQQITLAGEDLYCGKHRVGEVQYVGKKEVFCVETSTHQFETNGFVHHNSVTLRNVILHCLTHAESIAIALVDLKQTEFHYFKGVKGVVAVANTVQEAVEILRIMRECMYARNREMAKLGINDIKDFRPKQPTNEWMVFNHRLSGDTMVEVKTADGVTKSVTVSELEQYVKL